MLNVGCQHYMHMTIKLILRTIDLAILGHSTSVYVEMKKEKFLCGMKSLLIQMYV
jgi:hypothetical protein